MTLRRIHIIFFTVLFLCLFGNENLQAGVAISPAVVELSLKKAHAAGEFVIRNTGAEEERYRILASHFVLGLDGSMKKVLPDENSLVPWIKFNPKEFTLPPKSNRTVRFVIVPKGKAISKREYWCFMELESLKENSASATDAGGRTMKIRVVPSILVPIFATKGDISYSAAVEEVKIVPRKSDVCIKSIINNTGKGHLLLNGNFEVLDNTGNMIKNGHFGKNYILPGNQRELEIVLNEELPVGDYTVKLEYSAPQLKEPIRNEVQFSR